MGFFNFFQRARDTIKPSSDFREEYASEISVNANDTDLSDSYSPNGVLFGSANNACKLEYSGILAKDGAQEVIAVVNYGSNQNWDNIHYYPMRKIDNQSYELYFPVVNNAKVYLAFKDPLNNWDNNSGQNYTFNDGNY